MAVLGVDIGTTKTAAVVVGTDGSVEESASAVHGAGVPDGHGRCEQDAWALLASALESVRSLSDDARQRVRAVGVTGQMHGVVLYGRDGAPVSPLVNWQDQRCLDDPSFLQKMQSRSGLALQTGYGCATLAWLRAHDAVPGDAVGGCTIHDLLAARLCGAVRVVTDPTDAASWGGLDLTARQWDTTALDEAGVPVGLLPEVVPCGTVIGTVTQEMAEQFGIRSGLPVCAAIGDNQASLVATLGDPEHDLALTLGTGGQLSGVVRSLDGCVPGDGGRYEMRPYPGGRYLAVAASLCGGAAWAWLVDTVGEWCRGLGVPVPERPALFETIDRLACEATNTLDIRPSFLGERHDPSLRGRIDGIDLHNGDLGTVACSLAHGIARSFVDRLPAAACAGRQRVVGSGNALRRSAAMRRAVEAELGLPVVLSEGTEEAATGAALVARDATDTR